jgi:DNA-binding beta-propeller fold protein YncE
MRFAPVAMFLVLISVFQVARAEAAGEVNQLEASVRAIIHEHCGSCHDGALSTAKPAALKIFDLRERDWTARMSDDQLTTVVGRVKGKNLPTRQQAQVAQLLEQKREERAATAAPVPVEPIVPKLEYQVVPNFFKLPSGEHLVEPAGIAVNSKGHIYVFHRGKHPLVEFDPSGKFIRSIADDLFVNAHMVRTDAEDNIWTTDIGSHVVLKLSPEGQVLLALGRIRVPGDDVLHFNQPTDVASDRDGNIYVTDGYGNSRVLKFDRYGSPLLGWGMKGSGSGQFDTPHTIAIDGDRVYVGDRENARIQIFDTNGRFLQEWRLGHPFGLFITPDHSIYMCDAIASRILKIDRNGKVLGVLNGPQRGQGPHFDPHQIALGKDNSIFAAEVMRWRIQKFRLK